MWVRGFVDLVCKDLYKNHGQACQIFIRSTFPPLPKRFFLSRPKVVFESRRSSSRELKDICFCILDEDLVIIKVVKNYCKRKDSFDCISMPAFFVSTVQTCNSPTNRSTVQSAGKVGLSCLHKNYRAESCLRRSAGSPCPYVVRFRCTLAITRKQTRSKFESTSRRF